jgi:hypothetical protein
LKSTSLNMVDGFVGSGNFVHVIIQSFQQQHAELLLMYISNGKLCKS